MCWKNSDKYNKMYNKGKDRIERDFNLLKILNDLNTYKIIHEDKLKKYEVK